MCYLKYLLYVEYVILHTPQGHPSSLTKTLKVSNPSHISCLLRKGWIFVNLYERYLSVDFCNKPLMERLTEHQRNIVNNDRNRNWWRDDTLVLIKVNHLLKAINAALGDYLVFCTLHLYPHLKNEELSSLLSLWYKW